MEEPNFFNSESYFDINIFEDTFILWEKYVAYLNNKSSISKNVFALSKIIESTKQIPWTEMNKEAKLQFFNEMSYILKDIVYILYNERSLSILTNWRYKIIPSLGFEGYYYRFFDTPKGTYRNILEEKDKIYLPSEKEHIAALAEGYCYYFSKQPAYYCPGN